MHPHSVRLVISQDTLTVAATAHYTLQAHSLSALHGLHMKRLLGAAHGMNRPSAPKLILRQAATCQERRDTGLQPLCTCAPTRMTAQVCTPKYMWHTMQPGLHRSRGQRPFGSQHQTNKCRPSRTARSPRAGAMLSCGWCMPPHSPVCLRLQTTLRARWPQPHEQLPRHRRRAAAVPRSAS